MIRNPQSFSPEAMFGKRARNALDVTGQVFGELTAVSPGSSGYWRFRCERGHQLLERLSIVKLTMKAGRRVRCRDCKENRNV